MSESAPAPSVEDEQEPPASVFLDGGVDAAYDETNAENPMRPFTQEDVEKINELRQRLGVETPSEEEVQAHLDWQLELLRNPQRHQDRVEHDLNSDEIVNPNEANVNSKKAAKDKNSPVVASPHWRTDAALFRFLVSRGKDVDKAEEQYRCAMKWREYVKADTILAWYSEPAVMRKFFPTGFHGTDREGYPLLIELIGNIDLVGLENAVGETEFLLWVTWYHERQEAYMAEATRSCGKLRDKMTCIIDLHNLSTKMMSNHTFSVLKKRIRLEEDNYPEVVRRVLIIRAPKLFTYAWSICSSFLDQGTKDKMKILGSEYLDTLNKYLDIEALPDFIGGKNADYNICHGGTVPYPYIVGLNEGGKEGLLHKKEKEEIFVPLKKGQRIEWSFTVRDEKDIEFSSFFVDTNDETLKSELESANIAELTSRDEIEGESSPEQESHFIVKTPVQVTMEFTKTLNLPNSKDKNGRTSSVVPIQEPKRMVTDNSSWTLTSSEEGYAVLRWDNSHSWMTSKTIARRILVVNPKDDASASS